MLGHGSYKGPSGEHAKVGLSEQHVSNYSQAQSHISSKRASKWERFQDSRDLEKYLEMMRGNQIHTSEERMLISWEVLKQDTGIIRELQNTSLHDRLGYLICLFKVVCLHSLRGYIGKSSVNS